jgi:hypothetical protein
LDSKNRVAELKFRAVGPKTAAKPRFERFSRVLKATGIRHACLGQHHLDPQTSFLEFAELLVFSAR